MGKWVNKLMGRWVSHPLTHSPFTIHHSPFTSLQRSVFSPGVFIGVVLLLFFRPLICGVTFEWSNTYAQILIIVLLGLWVIGMLLKWELSIHRIPLPILLFSIALIISTIYSVSRGISVRQLYQFLSYPLLYLLIVNVLGSPVTSHQSAVGSRQSAVGSHHSPFIIAAIFLAAILVIAYGIYQYYFGLERMREFLIAHYDISEFHPDFLRRALYGREAFSTFLFAPALAAYLGMILPLALSFFIYLSGWKRIFPAILFISGVFCLYLTFSYGGWASSLFAIFLVLLVSLRKYRVHILSFAVIAAFLLLLPYTREFIPGVERMGRSMSASLEVRLDYWRATWEMIKDYPVFGSGPGTFASLYAQHKIPFAEETRMAHNNYLQVFSEMGILGIASFLWLGVAFLKAGWRKFRESSKKTEKALLLGCYAGIITFLINSFGYFDLYIPGIATYVWIFAGVVMATRKGTKAQSSRGTERQRHNDKLPLSYRLKSNLLRVVALIVVFFLLCSSIVMVRRPMLADRHSMEAHSYLVRGNLKRAASEVRGAIKLDPLNPVFHHQLGMIYQRGGILNQAVASFEEAIQLNPFISHYHYSLGKALWTKSGEKDEALMNQAVASFERARDYFPASVRYRLILAMIYKRMERKSDALAEYKEALRLDYERAVKIEPWIGELKEELEQYLK
ncbi:MAG: hypothetical protein DDT32_00884 [Syntrophomonadaceae bacterium]|nr:hypothetical protein [Bacillota bacterium]MBT9147132.1 hypothetical protein [Bacillota bacterium]